MISGLAIPCLILKFTPHMSCFAFHFLSLSFSFFFLFTCDLFVNSMVASIFPVTLCFHHTSLCSCSVSPRRSRVPGSSLVFGFFI